MNALPSPLDLFAEWRLIARELLGGDGAVEIPWICVDDEHAEVFARLDLCAAGLALRRIDVAALRRGAMGSGDWVLALFGSREIGTEEASLIREIRAREIGVYPLALLGNDYFKVPEGEVFHYSQPLATLRACCGSNPAVAFRSPRDLDPPAPRVLTYFNALGVLAVLPRVQRLEAQLRSWELALAGAGATLRARPTVKGAGQAFVGLLQLRIEALRQAVAMILDERGIARAAMLSDLEAVQLENQKDAVAERFPAVGASRLAAALAGTELLDLSRMVDAFLAPFRNADGGSWLAKELAKISAMDSLSTTVTFAGPFSSGKTTLLNYLLWGCNRLKTSKGHNTAILAEIGYGDSAVEHVELEWKRNVRLELLRPTDDYTVAIESPVAGEVVEIHCSPIYNAVWIKDQEGRQTFIGLGTRPPIVRRGETVRRGQLLSEGLGPKHRTVTRLSSFARRDVATLIELVEQGVLQEAWVELTGADRREERVPAKKILHRLCQALKEEHSDLGAAEVEKALGRAVFSLTFTARLSEGHGLPPDFDLDEEGWNLFQGDEALSEQPVCYLLLDRARIYLRHDFLRLASIVDTPGLGSVTDRHDETTESFLRGHDGLIIFFIRMDNRWQGEPFWRLLHLINSLPEKRTRDNVIVLCNWWSNKIPQDRLPSHLKRLRQWLGPRFREVFVVDLHRVLEHGETAVRVGDFGTFDELRELLRRRVSELGGGRRLRQIQGRINSLLSDRLTNLKTGLAKKERSEEELRRRRRQLEECLREIPTRPVSASMKDIMERLHSYGPVIALLDNKESWRQTRQALLDTARAINEAVEDDPFGGLLIPAGAIHQALQRVSLRVPFPDLPKSPRGSLPVSALEKKIDEVLRDWPWWSWVPFTSHRERQRSGMESWFNEKTKALLQDLEKHRKDCEQRINAYYKAAREEVQNTLAADQPGGEEATAALRGELAELQRDILPRWRKLSTNIDHVLERG
ncbi:MAG TPA: hypothetical protein DD490_29310 [Acidobacteria bacterium]|nr:hypothetical protein [Acidobacteriota bacterium]